MTQVQGDIINIIVFCVGGSKELAVLYQSYSTAAFFLKHGFVLYK